ncbi:MAG: hypothetical protein DWI58_18730 [Chloroflexi bacterium]|nr:MAG: hypothetical protein DWI58_18730 [Chloroflexota bacterium]
MIGREASGMDQQQQQILTRSGAAMGVTVALGMLAFGQFAGAAGTTPTPDIATAVSSPATQVAVAAPEPGVVATEAAAASTVATDPTVATAPTVGAGSTLQAREVSRVSGVREDDDDGDEDHDEDEDGQEKRREHR